MNIRSVFRPPALSYAVVFHVKCCAARQDLWKSHLVQYASVVDGDNYAYVRNGDKAQAISTFAGKSHVRQNLIFLLRSTSTHP